MNFKITITDENGNAIDKETLKKEHMLKKIELENAQKEILRIIGELDVYRKIREECFTQLMSLNTALKAFGINEEMPTKSKKRSSVSK